MFSTVEAAHLLKMSVKSVQRWIDQEQLEAGRTPGGHRRISADSLIAFLTRQRLPIPNALKASSPQILVVDDEPAVTRWITKEIKARHTDWGVAEAHDGFAAGGIIEATRPNVVILDLKMPTVDGYEVCRRIKNADSTKETAVIAITAYYSRSAEKAILECGARLCLSKPLDPDVLMGEIEKALSEHL